MRVQLLGRPAITGAEGPVELRGPRQAGLLALLGIDAGRVVRTRRIEDELWDGQRVSESAVRVNVNRLRARFQAIGGTDPIVSHTLGYALDVEPGDIDIAGFAADARATFAHRAAGRAAAALTSADAAEAWWRGPAFEGVAELASVRAEHVRLEALRDDVRQERAIALIELDALDEALAQLDVLLTAAPYRETAWGLRLYALARSGRRDEAATRYRELHDLLDRDLAMSPDPTLTELADALRTGDPDPAVARRLLAPIHQDRATSGTVSTGDAPARTRPDPAGPFVGRVELVDELGAFALGDRSQPDIVIVQGPPGIGKTRLAAEIAERSRPSGTTVLVGACPRDSGAGMVAVADIVRSALAAVPARVTATLEPLAALVPDHFGDVASSADPDPEIRRLQLFDAATRALAAIPAPVLVVVDDVHWVSADGGRFLHHLVERTDCRWLLLSRTADRTPAAVELLAELARWQPRWTTLSPLADDEVGELVERIAPGRDASVTAMVRERSGGNPFFATELLRHLVGGGDRSAVPPGVEQLVTASVQRLPAESVRIAEALTIAREPVPHGALSAAVDLAPTAVDAAVDDLAGAGLVRTTATHDTVLAHDLVVETLDARIGPGQRRLLHAALGRALAAVDPGRGPTALAHLLEAPTEVPTEELDHVAAVALRQLNIRAAYHQSAALGIRYLEATDANAATVAHLDARIQLATALMTAGPYGRGRALLDRIEPDVRRQGDASLSAELILARGSVNVANPELAVQVDEARLVLDSLDAERTSLRVQLAALIAHHLALLGRTREALGLLDEAEDENRDEPDPSLQATILAMRVQVASGPDTPPASSRRSFAELSAFTADHPSAVSEAWQRLFALDQAVRDGTLDDHQRAIDALERTVERFPRPQIRWAVAAARAGHALARGRLTEAERLIVDAQAKGGELSVGSAMAVWIIQLFMLQYERGDVAMMTPFLSSLAENSSPYQLAARALLHLESGDAARAREMAARLAERDRVLADAGAGWAALAAQLGDIAVATGDRRLAANVLDELGPHAGTALSAHGFLHVGAADRTLGLARATLGDLDGAIGSLEVAAIDDRRRGAVRWAGRASASAAMVLRRRRAQGDLAAARVHDQEAGRLLAPTARA